MIGHFAGGPSAAAKGFDFRTAAALGDCRYLIGVHVRQRTDYTFPKKDHCGAAGPWIRFGMSEGDGVQFWR